MRFKVVWNGGKKRYIFDADNMFDALEKIGFIDVCPCIVSVKDENGEWSDAVIVSLSVDFAEQVKGIM